MTLTAQKSTALQGNAKVPGDKSISHRSLMLASLAIGESRVRGLLEGEDVMRTAAAMRALGARINREENGEWVINGVGIGGLHEPQDVLDMGNSGTSARLLTGLLASHTITSFMTGDASLRKRPMARVTEPLSTLGTDFTTRDKGRLPMSIQGREGAAPLNIETKQASAQVKSAILLSGLNQRGVTEVRERIFTRDHTERMLKAMGANITSKPWGDQGRKITLQGQPNLAPINMDVPGDVSSAAFLLVAASIIDGSSLTLEAVGTNPLRRGIIDALVAMGAGLTILKDYEIGGEPVADIRITHKNLHPLPDSIPCHPSIMIDEFPILFVAAACTKGVSQFTGLEELRVKESDRLALMAEGLLACGVDLTETPDGMIIRGTGKVKGGAKIRTAHDHRIAMSFLILGQVSEHPITIDDASPIDTSFPGFRSLMESLGARFDGSESSKK